MFLCNSKANKVMSAGDLAKFVTSSQSNTNPLKVIEIEYNNLVADGYNIMKTTINYCNYIQNLV